MPPALKILKREYVLVFGWWAERHHADGRIETVPGSGGHSVDKTVTFELPNGQTKTSTERVEVKYHVLPG